MLQYFEPNHLQEALGDTFKVYLPSVFTQEDIFKYMVSGIDCSNFCRAPFLKVFIINTTAELLLTAVDAAILQELVENESCVLMKFASVGVTADCSFDTTKLGLVLSPDHMC